MLMEAGKNILVIRLKSIGDVILTLPAVNTLRDNFPSARITYLTSRENSVLLRGFREVNEIIALDRAQLRGGNPFKVVPEFFQLFRRLRAGKFSLVVDFQGYGETAWLARLSGAPQRWGGVYGKGRERAYTRSLQRDPQIHAAANHLALLRHAGLAVGTVQNQFNLPPEMLAAARLFFSENKLDPSRPVLFLQPFTSTPFKNWPLENFLAVARCWREREVQIIFGGGPADRPALQPAVEQGFCVAAGVPLLVTGGLLQLSTLVLGGDTGVLHLGVALGKRVLMLMPEVQPGSPIPFQHPDWVLVPPSSVIADISTAEVNAAVAGVFNQPAGNVSC